jgi:hypothetical protein
MIFPRVWPVSFLRWIEARSASGGGFTVQLAKRAGATVIATASARAETLVHPCEYGLV